MYGWRGRFGHVSPALHDTQAYEGHPLLPDGVMEVTTNLTVQKLVKEDFDRVWVLMEEAAAALAREEVGAIVIGGEPIFCHKGLGSHQRMIDEVYKDTGIPTSTTLSASMDGLKSLGVTRLVIVTPYASERNQDIRKYFEGSGFDVVNIKGLGITRNVELTRVPFPSSYLLAKEAFRESKEAEGIYISCGRWPVVRNIAPLEKDLGVPVVCNHQAKAWFALKTLGIRESIKGYGILLERLDQ